MNSTQSLHLTVPLGQDAHRLALQFAAEQATPDKGKQVYLNTLAVYAVHSYLKWLPVETVLSQGDSWHPGLRAISDVADLVLPNIGKLECRPVLPGEIAFTLPPEVTTDRIGYVAVQFSQQLDSVELLGFAPANPNTEPPDKIPVAELQSIDALIDNIHQQSIKHIQNPAVKRETLLVNLRQWLEGIFNEEQPKESTSNSQPPEQPKESTFNSVTAPAGTWLYGGSTSWAPIRDLVDQPIKQALPKFELTYSQHPTLPPGSGTGIKMLLDGQLSFSQSSRPILTSEYKIAQSSGVKLKQVPVAIDGIAIAVHASLNIQGLRLEQLLGIYTGQITNWKQVGGPNLKITPYSRPSDSGTTEFFKENILGTKNFASNMVRVRTTTEALNQIYQRPNNGGIYMASASEVIKQCTVKTLPISRHAGSAFIPPYQSSPVPGKGCPWQNNQLNSHALKVQPTGREFQKAPSSLSPLSYLLVTIDLVFARQSSLVKLLCLTSAAIRYLLVRTAQLFYEKSQVDEQVREAYPQLVLTDQGSIDR
jgi:ABC-type phosphate transport system substrate-binding protein